MERAIFAAGCFWAVQHYFEQEPGVVKTTVGYTGGHAKNPSYEEVSSEQTGHAEALLVEFDSNKVSYEMLVRHFFRMHDSTQLNRQGPDIGEQYRTAIFYLNGEQKAIAEKVRAEVQKGMDKPIMTEISPAKQFYEAEEYHQKFAQKTGRGLCQVSYEKLS